MWFALWQAVTLPGPYVPYLKTADMVGNYRLLQNIHLKMTQFAAVNVGVVTLMIVVERVAIW